MILELAELAELVIPSGLLYALVPVVSVGAISFAAWIVRELTHLASNNAATTANLSGVDKRVSRLEAWHDGFQFGRVVGKAEGQAESSSS